jgi:thiol-disulfide isomerase/thioredoxin
VLDKNARREISTPFPLPSSSSAAMIPTAAYLMTTPRRTGETAPPQAPSCPARPRPRRRWRRLALEIALVGVVIAAIGWWQTRRHARGAVPALTLQALGGGSMALREQLVERPTLLAFFAPWCGVCKVTSPNVRWIRARFGDRVRVVSIAADYEHPGQVRAYAAAHGVAPPILLDPTGEAARAFGVTAYPSFFFVDERGHITGSAIGYTTTLGMLARLFL